MFGKMFGKRGAAVQAPRTRDEAIAAGIAQGIAERSKVDPQIGAKLGAQDIVRRLTTTMMKADAKGVHSETLVAILGSLAGYACVVSALAYVGKIQRELAGPNRANVQINGVPIATVGGKDGSTYLTGDAINEPLFSASYSVLHIVYGKAATYGVTDVPDAADLAVHVIDTMGKPEFGRPRLAPGDHPPSEPPINYVRAFWPIMEPIARLYCPNEADWPLLFAVAAQQAIDLCKDTLAPAAAMRLAIECAVPMSRLHPSMLR